MPRVLFTALIFAAASPAAPALAYIGPGAGLSTIASALAFVGALRLGPRYRQALIHSLRTDVVDGVGPEAVQAELDKWVR